ncbi:hypothetical protein E6C67_26710 [Azospirillum sp. TSA2s]|uniref:hypothetical protein n=1 Tax=Azospirillum sp. TSA2s TaxID=709810 RepID=UPI0010A99E67|nr:hypothetical protein [Azospirillum sp. TSA2s]QCG97367.1 hypothetical protein E6C67_26710 [Azospirillum sp. TSA2s]
MKSLSEGIDATRQTIDRLTAGVGDKAMTDPRGAKTLGEAAMNADGSFNGARALSWLSEALNPGKGASEADVQRIWDETQAKVRAKATGV